MGAWISRRRLMGGVVGSLGAVTAGLPVGAVLAQTDDSNHDRPYDDGGRDEAPEQDDEDAGQADEGNSGGGEPGARGIELFRVWLHGELIRGDFPVQLDWSFYLLSNGTSFTYPPTWSVSETVDLDFEDLSDGNPVGGVVSSPDQSAGVLMLNMTLDASTSLGEAGWAQIERFVGAGEPTRLVEEDLTTTGEFTWAFLAGDVDGVICAGSVLSIPDPTTGGAFYAFNLAASRAEEFDDLTERVFLPVLLSQVTTGGGGGLGGDDDDDDEDEDDV